MTQAREGLADRVRGSAIEVHAPQPPSLAQMMERQQKEIEKALPVHLKSHAPAFVRGAITLAKQSDMLGKCDPVTILGGMMTAAHLGLDLGGPLGKCYLVPFYSKKRRQLEAQFVLGYRGVIDLAWRSDRLRSIAASEVVEGDQFDFCHGTDDYLRHKPDLSVSRLKPYAWYAVAKFTTGGHTFSVLNRDGVEAHRKRSPSQEKGAFSPWDTDYSKMACKSAVLELKPYLPLTVEIEEHLSLDGTVSRATSAAQVSDRLDYPDAIDAEPVDDEPAATEPPEQGYPSDDPQRPFE